MISYLCHVKSLSLPLRQIHRLSNAMRVLEVQKDKQGDVIECLFVFLIIKNTKKYSITFSVFP